MDIIKGIKHQYTTKTTETIQAVTRLFKKQFDYKYPYTGTKLTVKPLDYPEMNDDIVAVLLGTIGIAGVNDVLIPLYNVDILEFEFKDDELKFWVVFS